MGQQLSAGSRTTQRVIDVGQQAAATNLIDTGVWYYIPGTGKNIWGNRAALQLYNVSAEDFCGQQQAAWLSTGGEAALQARQLSNEQLLQALRNTAGQAAIAHPEHMSGDDVTVHITTTDSSSAGGVGSAKGSGSSCAAHAAFLPLPAGVLQVSARLSACSVLHKDKTVAAHLVQVVGVQHASSRARSGGGSLRRSLETLSIERNGSQLAALQLTLTQQLNLQPEVLPATQPLAAQQQQQQQQNCHASAAANTGDETVQLQHLPDKYGAAAAAAGSPGHSRLSLQSSSSSGGYQGPQLYAGAAVATMHGSVSSVACGPEVQAAAQRLRRSFERQAFLEFAAAAPATQPGVTSAGGDRSSGYESFGAAAAVPDVSRAHSSYARPPSHGMCKQQQQQQLGSWLSSGSAKVVQTLPGSGSGSSSGSHRWGSSSRASGNLPPPYLRTNSSHACLPSQPAGGECSARQMRMTEMCDNHAMFQFLFDAEGRLLAANNRATNNMREHLGEHSTYTLPQYLTIGQCDGGLSAEQIFAVISNAIFVNREPCFRLPQLRYSKLQQAPAWQVPLGAVRDVGHGRPSHWAACAAGDRAEHHTGRVC